MPKRNSRIAIRKTLNDDGLELTARFPKDRIYTVHQDGTVLDKTGKGVRVLVRIPIGGTQGHWEVVSSDNSGYGAGLLKFDKRVIVDYDGAFDLPHLVVKVLKQEGYELEWEKA